MSACGKMSVWVKFFGLFKNCFMHYELYLHHPSSCPDRFVSTCIVFSLNALLAGVCQVFGIIGGKM